jgi:hypothetical protein
MVAVAAGSFVAGRMGLQRKRVRDEERRRRTLQNLRVALGG